MNHDGYEGSNTCDPGAFIMSPTLDGNKNTWYEKNLKFLRQDFTIIYLKGHLAARNLWEFS